MLRNTWNLQKRRSALSIITLEILSKHDIESDKLEDILSSITKPGDFVFKRAMADTFSSFIHTVPFYWRSLEIGYMKWQENGLEIEFVLGTASLIRMCTDQNQLIYESFLN